VIATYRLQLTPDFTFADARDQVPYLAALGVSHLYLSPVLQAVPGSQHGYDVLDHTRISEELGGEGALVELADAAHQHGLGVIVDVVPNHMAFVAPAWANAPLWQVLRDGREAATAHWFDVDWEAGAGRLGVPVLGQPLEQVLADGELVLDPAPGADGGDGSGAPVLRYFDHVLPVAPGTLSDTAGLEAGTPVDRALLERQHYRLAHWREKAAVLNYRRFFDVDELIAVRVELPDVFEATHRLLLDLHHRGVLDGFRIDHPDGLADPEGYLRALRAATRPGTPVWVEKILEGDERLPRSWACAGTTGYDAMRAVSAALVDPASAPVLDKTWAEAGGEGDLEQVELAAKRTVVEAMLGAEVRRLVRRAEEALGEPGGDAGAEPLRDAVAELLVSGDVYRAYLSPGEAPDDLARGRLEQARDRALSRRPDLAGPLRQLTALALLEGLDGLAPAARAAAEDFAVRLQQTWGPVMAKGIEDTTFYRWHRLDALNEVGGDPGLLAQAGPSVLHGWATDQQDDWPSGMTTLTTHDTKRSEDVRARLLAVAGDPEAWQCGADAFRAAADRAAVDRPTAHLLWQTLVGVGPISRERLHGYLEKAVREAKQHTAWVDGDPDYEARVLALADRALEDDALRSVVTDEVAAQHEAVRATVLAQKLVQLCLPGVPDLYQGTELVALSLVDPDNRRPVDYDVRRRLLEQLREAGGPTGVGNEDLDAEKLWVTSTALAVRAANPDCFGERAGYAPLTASTEHALAFCRTAPDGAAGGPGAAPDAVACLVTRAPARLHRAGGWRADDTVTLPAGSWHDALTGRTHQVQAGAGQEEAGTLACRDLFARFPVALLTRSRR
jgi:(1->4)-alpha-D-glucan 1-alpha-D-glucosylmutase